MGIFDAIVLTVEIMERLHAANELKEQELEAYIALRNVVRKGRVAFAKSLDGRKEGDD